MASSFPKGFSPSTDRRSHLDLFSEIPCSFSERGFGLHRNSQTLSLPSLSCSIHACRSTHDDHTEPFTSRSSKATAIRSFVIAATTAVGLSLCPFDCFAIAAELEVNESAVLSVASVKTNPNIKPVLGEEKKVMIVLNQIDSSKPDQDLSFSMAIPIPYEKVWADAQVGFVAPLPHIHEHGSVTRPLEQPRRTAMDSVEGSALLQCPRWTPSDLEMVLPDYHGRPKPFPHQGRHWSATFVITEADDEAFLRVSAADDKLQLTEIGKTDADDEAFLQVSVADDELPLTEMGKTDAEMMTDGSKDKTDKKKKIKGNPALLKALAMEKSSCFSM